MLLNTHRPIVIDYREPPQAEAEQVEYLAGLPSQTPWMVLRDHPMSFGRLCGVIGLVILFGLALTGGLAL